MQDEGRVPGMRAEQDEDVEGHMLRSETEEPEGDSEAERNAEPDVEAHMNRGMNRGRNVN